MQFYLNKVETNTTVEIIFRPSLKILVFIMFFFQLPSIISIFHKYFNVIFQKKNLTKLTTCLGGWVLGLTSTMQPLDVCTKRTCAQLAVLRPAPRHTGLTPIKSNQISPLGLGQRFGSSPNKPKRWPRPPCHTYGLDDKHRLLYHIKHVWWNTSVGIRINIRTQRCSC